MQVPSLGWEDPLEEGMATDSSILVWEIPWTERSLVGYSPWGRKESDRTERLSTAQHSHICVKLKKSNYTDSTQGGLMRIS